MDWKDRDPRECDQDECRTYAAGHNVHFIQARLIGETPWGWRDAVVARVDANVVEVLYVQDDVRVELWHHRDLSDQVRVGEPVRLHERYFVLGTPRGWFCMLITGGGLGPVPEPPDADEWRDRIVPGVVNLGTGDAVATDHVDEARGEA